MTNGYTVSDSFENITVLYHRGCPQGFKFFGDDPEEHKTYIKEHHIEMLRQLMPNWSDFPSEFLRYFYLHSRCLLFTDGVWMSETAKYPHYLRYKPGTNVSFRVSGVTRFTSLTKDSGALCVGIDPDAKQMPCLKRFVHVINKTVEFEPMYPNSYLIPTENCLYGKKDLREGSISRASDEPVTLRFQKKGYMIEYTEEPFTMEESVLNYAGQWVTKHIEVFDR